MTNDFGRTASDRTRHQADFPEIFFDRLFADASVRRRDRVLDLGAGAGNLARGLSLRGCDVTTLDHSAKLLAQSEAMDRAAGTQVKQVRTRIENADFEPASFDLVSAGQCWHGFDRARAAALVRRWLRPGGRLLIAHCDWLPLAGNVVQEAEKLILGGNPGWIHHSGTGIYPAWLKDVAEAGFVRLCTWSFDVDIPYTKAQWRARLRSGIGVVLDQAKLQRFDAALTAAMAPRPTDEPIAVPHRVWALCAEVPGQPA